MCIRYRETFNKANWEAPTGCDRSRSNSGGWGKVPSPPAVTKGTPKTGQKLRGQKMFKCFKLWGDQTVRYLLDPRNPAHTDGHFCSTLLILVG